MNETTLVFIEACSECGRVRRVLYKRPPRRKPPALCADCYAARSRRPSSVRGR